MKECCKTGNEKPENGKLMKYLKIVIGLTIIAIILYTVIQSF